MEQSSAREIQLYNYESLQRLDESDDRIFYDRDRFVEHLDKTALKTVTAIIEKLVVEQQPVILDLMAGWDSHLPTTLTLRPQRITGLGLNRNELRRNKALTETVVHDLNRTPQLPFADRTFDVVLNMLSVDYMTQPFQVFGDVERILKPGGLFLVIFSNRMFPQKVVNIWREASEEERMLIVEDYFRSVPGFGAIRTFSSKGKPRPSDDKYYDLGIPSDPVYAVYAEKSGGESRDWERPEVRLDHERFEIPDPETISSRKQNIRTTLSCPYCEQRMKKWAVPQNPFTEWDNEFMYICFNDSCSYLLRGWRTMEDQGNFGMSYRLLFNPENSSFSPVPIPSLSALRESIIEE